MTELHASPLPSIDPARFVFGGVAFEIAPSPDLRWALADEHLLFSVPSCEAPLAAVVHCAVRPDPELRGGDRAVRWAWARDEATISMSRVRAVVRRVGPRRYVASAWVEATDAGCSSLVTALAALVVFREGGLVMHAAGIELDGDAVIFVGPSGAGKTTTSSLCRGARWLARDRVAIYPAGDRWWAAGLCGGDEIPLPKSANVIAPLAAVLRVSHGRGRHEIERSSATRALFDVRESVQDGGDDERFNLENALALIERVPVGRAAANIEEAFTDALRAWLR